MTDCILVSQLVLLVVHPVHHNCSEVSVLGGVKEGHGPGWSGEVLACAAGALKSLKTHEKAAKSCVEELLVTFPHVYSDFISVAFAAVRYPFFFGVCYFTWFKDDARVNRAWNFRTLAVIP